MKRILCWFGKHDYSEERIIPTNWKDSKLIGHQCRFCGDIPPEQRNLTVPEGQDRG